MKEETKKFDIVQFYSQANIKEGIMMNDLEKRKIAFISGAKVVGGFYPKDNVKRVELSRIETIKDDKFSCYMEKFDMRNAEELLLCNIVKIEKGAFRNIRHLKPEEEIRLIFSGIGEVWCEDLKKFGFIGPLSKESWSNILLVNVEDETEIEWLKKKGVIDFVSYIIHGSTLYKTANGEAIIVDTKNIVKTIRYIEEELRLMSAINNHDRPHLVFCNMYGEPRNVKAWLGTDIFFLHCENLGSMYYLYIPEGAEAVVLYKCGRISQGAARYMVPTKYVTIVKGHFCARKSDFLKELETCSIKTYDFLSDYEKSIISKYTS